MNFLYNGRNISYSDNGKGRVIVLLHGYLESKETWNGFADQLARQFRVIAVDLPGSGSSDTFGEIHTMDFMASIIEKLIDHLKIDKIFLTGHSLGGYVTLAFLEHYNQRLFGYCLFHSAPFEDNSVTIEKRKREIGIVKMGKKNLMYPDNVTRMYAQSNLEKFSDALQRSKDIASHLSGEGIIAMLNGMMARPSRLQFMEKGIVPCLWILGTMDNYIPFEGIQQRVHLPANAKNVVLENSGHMGFIEEQEKSVRVISHFVNEIE